jgi:hypothetical protein
LSGSTSEPREVTRHAVEQLRKRRPRLFPVEIDDWQIRAVVRREVTDALEAGRHADRKPIGFRLHGHNKARPLPEGQRIAWSSSGDLAWIIATDGAVITSLTRTGPAA